MTQKKNFKKITIREKDYEMLMCYKEEWKVKDIAEVVAGLIDYFEEDYAQEDTNYCVNCGDYHD